MLGVAIDAALGVMSDAVYTAVRVLRIILCCPPKLQEQQGSNDCRYHYM